MFIVIPVDYEYFPESKLLYPLSIFRFLGFEKLDMKMMVASIVSI